MSEAIKYMFYVKYKIGWQIQLCKIPSALQESMNLQFRHVLAPLLNPLYFSKAINTNNYIFNANYILTNRLCCSFTLLYRNLPFFRLKHNSESSKTSCIFSGLSSKSPHFSLYNTDCRSFTLCAY